MVADALDLPFDNEEFDNATSFFSGMYMSHEDKREVIKEVHRVIKPDGEFWIWDSKIKTKKKSFLIFLRISIPGKEKFGTGYGTKITEQNEEIYKIYLKEAGFYIEEIEINKFWFFIKAKKN